MTMLLAIYRLAPTPRIRMLIKWCIALFILICVTLCAQFVWVCEGQNHAWKSEPIPLCNLGLQIAVSELVTDIICDTLLVSIPLIFLSRSSLKRSQKYRLYAIFAAGVLTTIVSIVQDILVLRVGGWAPALAGTVMVGVSSIVSNIPVLVPAIRRLLGYESAIGGTVHTTLGRFSGTYPRHSVGPRWEGCGNKLRVTKPRELSVLSADSVDRSKAVSPAKTDMWAGSEDQDPQFALDIDIESSTADSTYRHPFTRTQFMVPPSDASAPSTPLSTTPHQTQGILVHQDIVVDSDS